MLRTNFNAERTLDFGILQRICNANTQFRQCILSGAVREGRFRTKHGISRSIYKHTQSLLARHCTAALLVCYTYIAVHMHCSTVVYAAIAWRRTL